MPAAITGRLLLSSSLPSFLCIYSAAAAAGKLLGIVPVIAVKDGALGAAARAGKRRPVDAHFPAAARQRAVEDAKQRRLPGAGRADDGHELPRLDAEGDVRQHLRSAAEALAVVCSFQQHGFTFRRT